MPTYQYACTACDHRFEAVQAFSDPSLTVCPECGDKLRKVYGSVGVVFKGSGFYRNDARSGNSKPATTPSGSTSGDKPATKSEPTSGSSSSTASTTSTSSSSTTSTTATKAAS